LGLTAPIPVTTTRFKPIEDASALLVFAWFEVRRPNCTIPAALLSKRGSLLSIRKE
jgi:hypothetical protein